MELRIKGGHQPRWAHRAAETGPRDTSCALIPVRVTVTLYPQRRDACPLLSGQFNLAFWGSGGGGGRRLPTRPPGRIWPDQGANPRCATDRVGWPLCSGSGCGEWAAWTSVHRTLQRLCAPATDMPPRPGAWRAARHHHTDTPCGHAVPLGNDIPLAPRTLPPVGALFLVRRHASARKTAATERPQVVSDTKRSEQWLNQQTHKHTHTA